MDDTYSEFLVEEAEEFLPEKLSREYNNDYWEHGYTIVQDRVPVFLTKVADKILSTGKYLNVIRQCGLSIFVFLSFVLSNHPCALQAGTCASPRPRRLCTRSRSEPMWILLSGPTTTPAAFWWS